MMIRHGWTPAVRSASFALDEPLEPAAVLRARELGASLPSRCAAVSGPERACVETGSELGLSSFVIEELAACDVGVWKGRSLAEVAAEDPEGLAGWMSDPHACPHGAESLTVFRARIVTALDARAGGEGFLAVVVDGGAVKAAIVHALGAPASAFWRVDVAPLSVTEIHVQGGRWTLARANCPLAISISSGNRWLIGTILIVVLAYYFIGVDEGAASVFGKSIFIHEFVHDARHLLGFPCH